ncbi:MAG: hypothetical protein WDM84_04305 [Bauldia sp.]
MLKILVAAGLVLSALSFSAVPASAAGYGSSSAPMTQMKPVVKPMRRLPIMVAPGKLVRTAKGLVLADVRGFTLYTYGLDLAGRSACYGPCAIAWPPFRAGPGAGAFGPWTLVSRIGGTQQWAYKGQPLYFWVKDHKPGDVTGDGVGGFHVAR